MRNIVEDIKNQIDSTLRSAFEKAELGCDFPENYVVEKPREKAHGDFSANLAMLLAKPAKKAPRQVAEALVGAMNLEGTYIEKVEIEKKLPSTIFFVGSPVIGSTFTSKASGIAKRE